MPFNPLRRGDPEWLGAYRLTGRLGSGGMGVVYLGEGPDGRYVAIKLVHAALADDPEFRDRFRSEVDRARQVPSFCTAEVLGADLDHQPPYLVVEYVDGPSLAEVVDEHGPLGTAHLHSVAVGVATALAGIHGAGVIHRDLKPENVLLAPGSPKVIDFGIARAFEATSKHTRTDQMVGTVAYMAPERFSSAPGTELTAAADVFAWGCVVGYAGTGRTPFHGDSPPATAGRILTQPPHLDGLAEPLRGMVALSLAKDPADRPTARELLDMLVGGAPVPPPAAPRRSRWLAVLAVLLIVGGVGTALALRPDRTSAVTAPAATVPSTATPSPRPSLKEPADGEPIIQDRLTRPEQWLDSGIAAEKAGCSTRGVLRAVRIDAGTFQCAGPPEEIEDDFGVAVSTTLESAGSCSAIWFHLSGARGGQVLRACPDAISIAYDRKTDHRVLGTLRLPAPIAIGTATRLHFTVRDRTVDVWRDGDYLGAIQLPSNGPTEGQVQLGLSVPAGSKPSRYAVTFANVDIRSLGD